LENKKFSEGRWGGTASGEAAGLVDSRFVGEGLVRGGTEEEEGWGEGGGEGGPEREELARFREFVGDFAGKEMQGAVEAGKEGDGLRGEGREGRREGRREGGGGEEGVGGPGGGRTGRQGEGGAAGSDEGGEEVPAEGVSDVGGGDLQLEEGGGSF
jgi:hypothetical protein